MTTTLDLVANNPKAHEASKCIESLIKTMKTREVQKNALLYPSVEISL